MNLIPNDTQRVYIPPRQFTPLSLTIRDKSISQFSNLTAAAHKEQFTLKQKVIDAWNSSGITKQYMIYAEIDKDCFAWSIIPYQACKTFLGRAVQQLQVLWRIIFGGFKVSDSVAVEKEKTYKALFEKAPTNPTYTIGDAGNDAFCDETVIQRQVVITGRKVDVLFNYAPIGFGGEKLHFLVVPRDHFETFSELSEEAYMETMQHTQHLVEHFTKSRPVKKVYLMNKTGIDAGQTVKHWHMHVIFSTNTAQDWFGKLTVVWNILFGARPLSAQALAARVTDLRKELA
jgi:diadenosine tetraphosphate (Ap4A) HIT family hydrolase